MAGPLLGLLPYRTGSDTVPADGLDRAQMTVNHPGQLLQSVAELQEGTFIKHR